MSALVIVSFNVLDQEKIKQYSATAGPTVASHGGKFIVKGKPSTLHGDGNFDMTAVIQFTDKETANNWYNSTEYQAIVSLRNEAMESHFQIIG